MLIALRAAQGIGLSLIFVNSFSIIVSAFPVEKRGRVLGFLVASVYTGLSAGPFLGGIITQHLGWRYIFFISAAVSIVVFSIMLIFITKEWKPAEGQKFDLKGSVIFAFAITSFMLGISFLPQIHGLILTLTGLAVFYYYRIDSRKTAHPVLKLNIFRNNKVFTFSNAAALINYSATAGISFMLSLYLQNIKTMSPQDAGLVLISQPLLMAFFSPVAGRISDKIEPQYVASAGMTLITVCLGFLCFISYETSILFIILNLSVLGIGFALFSSPNSNAIMSSVEKKEFGTASTILALMRTMGQMMSMAAVIVIFSIIIGKAEIKQGNTGDLLFSLHLAFAFFSFLCFLGIFASLFRGKMHK